MKTEMTDYDKLEKFCAEERLSAPVGVDYAVSLHEMHWFRFNGCEPSGKFSKSGLMQAEENVQVYLNKEWHPVLFYTTCYSGPANRYYKEPCIVMTDLEKAAQAVKDSVDRGQPNRELSTASRYLLLAATNICEEAFRNFSGFLDHFQSDEAEYWALDAKKAMDQTHRVLNVLAKIEGLDIL